MTVDPRELMNMPMEDAPEPTSLPPGHYYGQILRYEEGSTPWNSESRSLLYHCQLTEPGSDIPPEAVKDIDLRSFQLRPLAYEIIPDRMRTLRTFFESLGLSAKNSFAQNVVDSIGKRVLLTVTAAPGKRPGDNRIFNNITFMVGAKE